MESWINKISKKIENTNANLSQIKKEVKGYVDQKEIKGILAGIDSEFDVLRKNVDSVKKSSKSYVKEKERTSDY